MASKENSKDSKKTKEVAMRFKRKNYIIDKTFQFRFIATFLVMIVIALVVFTAAVLGYYYVRYLMGDSVYDEVILVQKSITDKDASGNVIKVPQPLPDITNRFYFILPFILINNLFIMVIICILGLFYSHTIAGPIFRIEQDIEKFLKGDKNVVVRLREKDKLQGLADKVNRLMKELKK